MSIGLGRTTMRYPLAMADMVVAADSDKAAEVDAIILAAVDTDLPGRHTLTAGL